MLQHASLVLRDGTTLDDLVMRDTNEVSLRVMTDEELYHHEMERIFSKTWLLLGHESEIPKAGDFIVDRGVIHAWRNDGAEVAASAVVTIPAKPVGKGKTV